MEESHEAHEERVIREHRAGKYKFDVVGTGIATSLRPAFIHCELEDRGIAQLADLFRGDILVCATDFSTNRVQSFVKMWRTKELFRIATAKKVPVGWASPDQRCRAAIKAVRKLSAVKPR
jgi:hypothetical protein